MDTSLSSGKSTGERIHSHIKVHPGVHFNEIVRELDLATGQVQSHIRRLIRRNQVVERSIYGKTHYYTPSFDEWEQCHLALARRETPREILFYLLEQGTTRPDTVANDIDIARSTLEWHLTRLQEQDIIRKQQAETGNVELAIIEPKRTVELLARVTPTASDKLADRFIRFVDRAFEPLE